MQTKRLVKSIQTHSEVHLAVDSSLVSLSEIIYPGAVIHPLKAHAESATDSKDILEYNSRSIKDLAANDFDLVVNLNFSGLNFSLSRLFDPDIVKGYKSIDGQEMRHPWTRLFFRLAGQRRLSPINLMDFWGYFAPFPIGPDKVNPPASEEGQGLGVVLAGRNLRRSVPVSSLTMIIQALRSKMNSKEIILLGSNAEKPVAKELKSHIAPSLAGDINDLTGKTSLKDLKDVVSSLQMVLTPDTGTMHLAAHLGVKVTAIFVSSAYCFETGPYGQGHSVFQAMPACAPCVESRQCNFDLVCHDILKQREAVRALWKGKEQPLENAVIYKSYTDDLGVGYQAQAGVDKFARKRNSLRELIRRHLRFVEDRSIDIPDEVSRIFFHEKEWML
ncbi:MAG: glycosyltransferase family 9 protein [Desulfonatronovibrio sp.]